MRFSTLADSIEEICNAFIMKHVHFIAIGGAAMHNIALALHAEGIRVTGSDDEIFEPSRSRLLDVGLLPEEEGWFPEKLETYPDCVILGMHAKADNPELKKANELGIKVYSYPAFLYARTLNKFRVVIGGSHGKTTITSMILHACKAGGIACDYLVGSQLAGFDRMAFFSESNRMSLFEGDEYWASPIHNVPKFHLYKPNLALISGIAWDHVNVFPSFSNYKEQFHAFVRQVEPNGTVVYNAEDPEVREVIDKSERVDISFVPYSTPNYERLGSDFFIISMLGRFKVSVKGKHNLQNLSGALEVAKRMGVSEETFLHSMGTFRGADRRMEVILDEPERTFTVIRDFGHSPSKVTATLSAVKEAYPDRMVVCLFELHTFSSLSASYIPLYKGAFDSADLLGVYFNPDAIKQKRLPSLEVENIAELMQTSPQFLMHTKEEMVSFIKTIPQVKSVVLLMSSGNFGGIEVKKLLEKS
jgi:UDP-N-acetylmuramate: L-alanyl-gamma-D-glutamyl-meso-diaminopimelate ligase